MDVFSGLDGFGKAEDLADTMTEGQMGAVMKHLRQFGVFFSYPLDLDMVMLDRFWTAYTELEQGERGPQDSDATDAVLGGGGMNDYWQPADDDMRAKRHLWLRWYRYLFLTRSKPSTHLRALARLSDTDLRNRPEPVLALIHYITAKLSL